MKAQTGVEMMKAIPDLVLMSELSEDEMLRVLSRRLADKRIYTYIGEVCISVNPYTSLPIYGADRIKEHDGMYMYQLEPHVYAVAENMYRELRATRENQCVLVSGESGAGKTEAAKKILEYIAAVSQEGAGVARIKEMLLDSNPILEAFGNAKTLRNDNSSRFGKYMELSFDFAGAPQGGRITNYLLEKVRVVQRTQGERSFHIFYQLLSGLSDQEVSQLGISRNPDDYVYLKKSACHTVQGVNDKMEFKRVRDAMKVLQMTGDVQMQVWRLLAGILLLGNVEFVAPGNNKDKSAVKNKDVVQKIADLLKVKPAPLDAALVSRTIRTGNQAINTPLNLVDANASRDAFAKSLYFGLFDWIVAELNKVMAPKTKGKEMTVGILDIYGFEIFEDNSFEQFCINWCNEKLQQYFIELTLKLEQEEYAREGIAWTPVEYFDNRIICELIEKKPGGILAILDEDCLLASATDESFLDKLNKNVGAHKHFKTQATEQKAGVKGSAKLQRDQFILLHYAGEVAYKVPGFINKNRDILFNDQVQVINGSADTLVATVFKNVASDSMKRPDTAGTKFKSSLAALVDALSKCRPHYVRCIKPNEDKAALKIDETRFRHQLRYLGLLENVRVRRAGFCYRQTYEKFLQRYKMTCPSTWTQWRGNAKAGCEEILRHHKVGKEEFRLGKTKVFIKNPPQLFAFEEAREAMLPTCAIMIQKQWRKALARMYFKKLRAAVRIQRALRAWKSRKWLVAVVKAFKPASRANNYGMDIPWPPTPPVLKAAQEHIKRIQRTWRGTDIIRQIPENLRPVYRTKIRCYDIFHGQKPWDPRAPFGAPDHLANEALNPEAALYKRRVAEMRAKLDDGDVLYSDNGEKMMPGGAKMVPRNIVVTTKAIYKFAKYKAKEGIPLSQITRISMSHHNDSLIVIHNTTNRAHVINLAPRLTAGAPPGANDNNAPASIGKERYSEFIIILVDQLKKVKPQQPVQVEFVDSVTFNAAKKAGDNKPCTIQFVPDAAVPITSFRKGKQACQVTYTQ